jgi:hypothetical protein
MGRVSDSTHPNSDPASGANAGLDLGAGASADLRWLAGVLWGGLEGVRVVRGDAPAARERYVAVPTASAARMLLPADTRAIVAALRAGNGLRPARVRAAREATALTARLAGRTLMRDRFAVLAADDEAADRLPSSVIGRAVGREVVLGVNVRPPTPSRKPVAQLLDRRTGELVAYAKLAWSSLTDANIVAEADALEAIAAAGGSLRVPAVIHRGTFRGHSVVVTAPMPSDMRPWPRDRGAPPPTITAEVATAGGLTHERFADSACRGTLEASVRAARGMDPPSGEVGALADALDVLLEALGAAFGDVELPFGWWHGDWSPWNLGLAQGRVWAWDWEYARPGVPYGIDLPHYHFQTAFILQRQPLSAAFTAASDHGGPLLRALGLVGAQVRAALAVHAALVGARYLDAAVAGAAPNPRVTREGGPALRALAAAARG